MKCYLLCYQPAQVAIARFFAVLSSTHFVAHVGAHNFLAHILHCSFSFCFSLMCNQRMCFFFNLVVDICTNRKWTSVIQQSAQFLKFAWTRSQQRSFEFSLNHRWRCPVERIFSFSDFEGLRKVSHISLAKYMNNKAK